MNQNKLKLDNSVSTIVINLEGGSYIDFRLKTNPVNPLNWHYNGDDGLDFEGHFICFDRWGPPSVGEAANGFKHHGEASSIMWDVLSKDGNKNAATNCTMRCRLPKVRLELTRKIKLSVHFPVFKVTETIKNRNKNGRIFNVVQHVSIAPPFLDNSTLFDTNAVKGFEDKENGRLNQEEPIFIWPNAIDKNNKTNLRIFDNTWPRVCTFLFEEKDEYAWVSAANPAKNLLLAYCWKTAEYPWINFWRSMENGVPKAFGIEFGTTGLHEPMTIVAKKGKIFGQNIYDFIDSNEAITKSFIAVLAEISTDYKGVENIQIVDSKIIIKEKEGSGLINYKLSKSIAL